MKIGDKLCCKKNFYSYNNTGLNIFEKPIFIKNKLYEISYISHDLLYLDSKIKNDIGFFQTYDSNCYKFYLYTYFMTVKEYTSLQRKQKLNKIKKLNE